MTKCASCNKEKLALIPLCQRCIIRDREKARADLKEKLTARISGYGIETHDKTVIETLNWVLKIIEEESPMASESLGDKPIITAGSHSHTETAKAVGSPSGMPRENSGSPKPEKPNIVTFDTSWGKVSFKREKKEASE